MPRYLLLFAALPAIAMSLWLMQNADAPRSALILQAVVAGVAAVAYVVVTRVRRVERRRDRQWLALVVALTMFVPLRGDAGGGPERWIVLGGFRLYISAVVLPLMLLVLGASLRPHSSSSVAAVMVAAAELVLQPDAAQLTAFALPMLFLVISELRGLSRVGLLAVLLSSVVVVWRLPDPLAPVRYVEGVFVLAADASSLALVGALLFAALPVAAFAWIGRTQRTPGALAVALYYATLFALAPLQVTPVPLLGFGTGPVLGYFLVSAFMSSDHRS